MRLSTMRQPDRRTVLRLVLVWALCLFSCVGLLLETTQASSAAATDTPFSKSETITRTQIVDGKDKQVDKRTVGLTVDRTQGLQDQEQLSVSWTGAHPTSNYYGDPNATSSDLSEYPMVLLQCRGGQTTVKPETCWAPLGNERVLTTGLGSGADDIGTFPAWRLDRYAAPADRKQFTGTPSPATTSCPAYGSVAERVVPFIAHSGKRFYGSGLDTSCGDSPPEAAAFSDSGTVSSLPDNAAFALTGADGSGAYKFSVRDSSTNASLGCSATVTCSLVAIPIIGISCNPSFDTDDPNESTDPDNYYDAGRPDRALTACQSGAAWPLGQGSRDPALAVSGQLWWSASNWRNRIVVPLTFAPVAGACDFLNGSSNAPAFFGSESAMQATTEWSAKLCLTQGATSFDHVETAEPLARTLVSTGAVKAALTSQQPSTPFTTPTVQAPVAATGFSISYTIDKSDGTPYTKLKLDARLLAKLMTESYPDTTVVQQNYKALADNPLNITLDPEFQALNPGVPEQRATYGAASLFSISTPSDVIFALTSYINADPEARAWLDGYADPWGMKVNRNYRHISLPVNAWPLADSWTMPTTAYGNAAPNSGVCEGPYGVQPQPPYLQLIASPVQSMVKIAQGVEYAQPGDGNACKVQPLSPGTVPGSIFTAYTRAPRQFTGQRFVIGLTSLADASHYSLDSAALETSSSADPADQITDSTGRTFVGPTNASLQAAFGELKKDSTNGGWDLDYSALRKSAPAAYPGAMLIYADVPTKGLGSVGRDYASVLRYMIGPGQVQGPQVGQLPGGYLPLTAANGFADQVAYTNEAVDDVATQQGLLPGQKPPASSTPPSTSPPPSNTSTRAATPPHSTASSSAPSTTPASNPVSSPGGQSGTQPLPSDGGLTGGASTSGAPRVSTTGSSTAPTSTAPTTPSTSAGSSLANAANAALKTPGEKNSSYQNLLIVLLILLAAGPLAALSVYGRRYLGPR